MTIDEAIKTLSERFHDPALKFDDDYYDAIQLGIEALKRHKGNYLNPQRAGVDFRRLPGETEK